MELVPQTILVLGAGFTKAFVPAAPLLVDDYGAEDLLARFSSFPHARRLLESETQRNSGLLDLEALMTRLDGLMPYDDEHGAILEYGLLLSEIRHTFRNRLEEAKLVPHHYRAELRQLARYCINNRIDCVTFNYDDVFDEELWRVGGAHFVQEDGMYWHPDGGYGFFCRPSETVVRNVDVTMDRTSMLVLKLHGSMNWFARRGASRPYEIDAIVHDEHWFRRADPRIIGLHIESDPFIVPPVLVKSVLVEQPILRVLWSLAFRKLAEAENVIFVGYSLPVTDIAARSLFRESLAHRPSITVVNRGSSAKSRSAVAGAYRSVFPWLKQNQFIFCDAKDWAIDSIGIDTSESSIEEGIE